MTTLFKQTLFKGKGHWTIEARADGPWRAEDYSASNAWLIISHATTEAGKEVVKASQISGKNIGRANETSDHDQAISEAKARVLKQRDKGYVDTREEAAAPVTNTLGRKRPQLSVKLEDFKGEVDWATAFIQPKLDGNRALNDDILYSRPGNEFVHLGHVSAQIAGTPLASLHLDGELYTHGVPLQTITGFCKKLQDGTLDLVYWVYDSVSDKPFSERYADLEAAFSALPAAPTHIKLTPTFKVSSMEEALRYLEQFEAEDYEGAILRWGNEGYQDDVRSVYSLKIKSFADMEVEICDYEWGTPNRCPEGGEYLNPTLVYKVPGTDRTAKITAPGSHLEKHQTGLNIDEKMGTLLTLKHKGFTKAGVPAIATAKCWHDPI